MVLPGLSGEAFGFTSGFGFFLAFRVVCFETVHDGADQAVPDDVHPRQANRGNALHIPEQPNGVK